MSTRPPHPSHASLVRLLAAAQRPRNPQLVSNSQLQWYVTRWFPRDLWARTYAAAGAPRNAAATAKAADGFDRFHRIPVRVSYGWAAALDLVELARCVPASPQHPNPTLRTIEHILRCGVFPADGWAVTLALLELWRQERQPVRSPAAATPAAPHDSPRSGEAAGGGAASSSSPLSRDEVLLSFPSYLRPPATAQLLYHLSLAPSSPQRCEDALRLYRLCATQTLSPTPPHSDATRRTSRAGAEEWPAVPASSALLKALRHMCLTTLLQAGAWERGLRFYYHSLYQRDLPGTITTGYLVQELGRAGRWDAVLQVYDLCVRLLRARRHAGRSGATSAHPEPSREWGTTLSMAMAAAQGCEAAPSTTLLSMLRQLQGTDGSSGVSQRQPPLVQLDGNFLAAVEALPDDAGRQAALALAAQAGLLDTFRLIRGLASKHRWEAALLLLLAEATGAATPSTLCGATPQPPALTHSAESAASTSWPSARLTQHEVSAARLHVLHSTPLHAVAAVVLALNRQPSLDRNDTVCDRDAAASTRTCALQLSDEEVECVLSKTLEVDAEAAGRPSHTAGEFWQFCLAVVSATYAQDGEGGGRRHSPSQGGAATTHARAAAGCLDSRPAPPVRPPRCRRPTDAALSFLLRHPRLPWRLALQLVERYGLLDTVPPPPVAAARARHGETRRGHSTQQRPATAALAPRALALSAAVERLLSQGQPRRAEALALRALAAEVEQRRDSASGVSLSAALLRAASRPTLRQLLWERRGEGLYVDSRVLFHLLQESVALSRQPGRRLSTAAPAAVIDSDAFFAHPCGRVLTLVHLLMTRPSGACGGAALGAVGCAIGVPPLPASLFVLNDGLGGSAEAGRVASPWLLAYPPSVHCEVVRAVGCVTADSVGAALPSRRHVAGTEGARASLRWTWTLRYVAAAARYFVEGPAAGDGRAAATGGALRSAATYCDDEGVKQRAREAYYAVTYEAVVSLLETSPGAVPECCSAYTSETVTVEGEQESASAAAPSTSVERVLVLGQMLERAVDRYGCFPPTHMLLPNQLDRLLPPLSDRADPPHTATGAAKPSLPCAMREVTTAGLQERCAVAAQLLRLILHALRRLPSTPSRDQPASRPRGSVEPAFLTNALKLCCRVAEHRRELRDCGHATGADVLRGGELCEAGFELLRRQCVGCGLHTVRPASLSLLYHLCAAVQSSGAAQSTVQARRVALEATVYLLNCQQSLHAEPAAVASGRASELAAAARRRGESVSDGAVPTHGDTRGYPAHAGDPRAARRIVQAQHCRLFFSLFGWEDALQVWYSAFPRAVLEQISGNPHAIEACLSLGENDGQ